jgi:hypothetical protein
MDSSRELQTAGYNVRAGGGQAIARGVCTPSSTQSDVKRNSPQQLLKSMVAGTKGGSDEEDQFR